MSVFPYKEWWSLLTEEPLAEREPGPKPPLTPAPRPRPGEVSFLLIAITPGGKAVVIDELEGLDARTDGRPEETP